ncbi:tetratricopeptide repeat protein [Sungkyunkwania multivorans]|uniref:Tetratricopeptide repeat protein n=1 Tax=Sungkyunkwania multivorans TaxID=1173618 RepID=A0ABW3CZ42_9FLAO
MYYYLILGFQAFCVYHCYKNRNDRVWYFLIIFLPLIGCVVYLFTQVYSKKGVEKVQEKLTETINPSKKVLDLEKKVQFADTFENRVALGDAYLSSEMYEKAATTYLSVLKGTFENDFYVVEQLISAYYLQEKDQEVIQMASRVKEHKEFRKSNAQFLYGLSLARVGNLDEAFEALEGLNVRYSNYEERVALAMLYEEHGRNDEAKEIYQEIVSESENMQRPGYRTNKKWIEKAKEQL